MDDQIADELSMSERTVKEIQVNLMRKWNAHTISSAIDYALGSGLITIYEIALPQKLPKCVLLKSKVVRNDSV
jgi:hypothetical protein